MARSFRKPSLTHRNTSELRKNIRMEGPGKVVEMILGVKKKHKEKCQEADKDQVT